MATKNNNYNVDSITRINSPLKRNGGGFIGQSTDIDWQDIQSEFGDELNSVRIITELEKLKDLNLEDLANKLEQLWTWYQNGGGGTTPVIYPTRDNTHLLVDEANAMVSVVFDEPNTQYDTIEWSTNNSYISIEASSQTPTIANITNRSTAPIRSFTITCKINFNNTYLELTANASISGGGGIIIYPTSSNTSLRVNKENNKATVNVIIASGVSYDSIEWTLDSNQDDNIITLDKINNNRTCVATNISQSLQTIRIKCKIYYGGNTSNAGSLSLRTSEIELPAGAQNIPSFDLEFNPSNLQISITNPTNFDLNDTPLSYITWYVDNDNITVQSSGDKSKVNVKMINNPSTTTCKIYCTIEFDDNDSITKDIDIDIVKITFKNGSNTVKELYYFKGQPFNDDDLILNNYTYTFNYNNNLQYRTWTKKIDDSNINISTNTTTEYNISIISSWDNNTLPTVNGLDNGLYVVWTYNNEKLTSLPNTVTSNKTYTGTLYSNANEIEFGFSGQIYDYILNNNQFANINKNGSSSIKAILKNNNIANNNNINFENQIVWSSTNSNISLSDYTSNGGFNSINCLNANRGETTTITAEYTNNDGSVISKNITVNVKNYISSLNIVNLDDPNGTEQQPAHKDDIIRLKADNMSGEDGEIFWNINSHDVFDTTDQTSNPVELTCVWNSTNLYNTSIRVDICDANSGKTVSSSITGTQLWAQNPQTPSTTYYWYVGITKPTSLDYEGVTTISEYPTQQPYTNPSTTEKNYFHVLTNADKTVNFYDPSDLSTPSTKIEDTTTIPGYKITSMTVRVAKGGTQVIKIS